MIREREPNFAYRAESLVMVRGLVGNGFGYTLFNSPMACNLAFDGTELVAIPLTEKLRPLRMGVARLSPFRPTPPTGAFIQQLEEPVRELSSRVFEDKRFYRLLIDWTPGYDTGSRKSSHRKNKSPAEILFKKPHKHWLEMLSFDRFKRATQAI